MAKPLFVLYCFHLFLYILVSLIKFAASFLKPEVGGAHQALAQKCPSEQCLIST